MIAYVKKQKPSLEEKSYFGHNWSIITEVEIKVMDFSKVRISTKVPVRAIDHFFLDLSKSSK